MEITLSEVFKKPIVFFILKTVTIILYWQLHFEDDTTDLEALPNLIEQQSLTGALIKQYKGYIPPPPKYTSVENLHQIQTPGLTTILLLILPLPLWISKLVILVRTSLLEEGFILFQMGKNMIGIGVNHVQMEEVEVEEKVHLTPEGLLAAHQDLVHLQVPHLVGQGYPFHPLV